MTRCEEMIIALFPSARPGVDFEISIDDSGRSDIARWDEVTLGKQPQMCQIRKKFLEYLARKQKIIPTLDMSDPCPWLDEAPPMEEMALARSADVPENCPKRVLIVR